MATTWRDLTSAEPPGSPAASWPDSPSSTLAVRPYRRVLALIDFNHLDERIANKAMLFARLNQVGLDFLHLVEPDGLLDGCLSTPQASARSLEQAALRRLSFLAAGLGAAEASCHAICAPLRQGFRLHVGQWAPDLIVTGEQHAYLGDAYDVLVLSTAGQWRSGRLLSGLRRLLGTLLTRLAA